MHLSGPFIILMALIGELGFMAISILAKRLRRGGVTSRAILAAYGLTLPVWIGVFVYYTNKGEVEMPPLYMACLLAWLVTCYFLNFGSVFVSRFQSLSEGTGYRFGFSVLIAAAMDLFIFKTTFDPVILAVLGMLFVGGLLLHFSREKMPENSKTMVPLHYKIGLILVVSLAEVSTYALFKYGAGLQTSVLAHNAIFQMMMFAVFLIVGGSTLIKDRHEGYFPTSYLIAFFVLTVIAASADAFAVAGLPVTLFIMFSLIRAVCFAVHDLKTREVPFNVFSILALVLIAAGIVSTVFVGGF